MNTEVSPAFAVFVTFPHSLIRTWLTRELVMWERRFEIVLTAMALLAVRPPKAAVIV